MNFEIHSAIRSRVGRLMASIALLGSVLAVAPGSATVLASTAAAAGDDATSHRRFDDATYWSGVFDDPARDAWQKPAELVAALNLRAGQCVADLGAGTGYFSARLAAAVGASGAVFAVDVEPSLVAHLRDRAERDGLVNLTPVLGSLADPRLPAGRVDLVLIVDTYHHLDARRAYFRNLARALRPGGRVVVVDWKKEPLPEGPEMEHKLAREQVVEEMAAAGYRLQEALDLLPYQYVLVFTPESEGASKK